MLHHDQRVAQIAQLAQGREQLRVVALVQADARLIQNIEHAHQGGADLRGEPDALRFAAGERARRAAEREIIQPDACQEVQTAADLLEDQIRDFPLALRQRQRVDKGERLRDGKARERVDVDAADRHAQ